MAEKNQPPVDWWRQAVVYQVYPRSFYDADGDGLGELRGVTAQMGYLRRLGVDAIWLSPFYPSPLADGGYDVADYRDVDPRLGTLADFDEMVAAAHAAGIKVVVDIVPNHISTEHPWVPGGARRSPRVAGTRPLRLPPRPRRDGRASPQRLAVHLRRASVGAGRRRRVVPAPLCRGAGRPQLGEPRGSRGLQAHAALLV